MNRRETCTALAASWLSVPEPVRAQDAAPMRRVAVLVSGSASHRQAESSLHFRELLRQAGHEIGRNLQIERHFAEGDASRLQMLAQEVVRMQPDLIVVFGNEAAAAAQRATARIPIVMSFCADPVAAGLVRSLAQPGGNLTGAVWVSPEIAGKTLQVLKEAVPQARRVGALGTAFNQRVQPYRDELLHAAQALGLTLAIAAVDRPGDVTGALQRLADSQPDALHVAPDAVTETRIDEIAAFTLRHQLPALGVSPSLVNAGGLLYYGPDTREMFERTASFVDRILRGAAPATLPVEQPTRFKLVVNLRTARAMGLSLPRPLLARADEVIE